MKDETSDEETTEQNATGQNKRKYTLGRSSMGTDRIGAAAQPELYGQMISKSLPPILDSRAFELSAGLGSAMENMLPSFDLSKQLNETMAPTFESFTRSITQTLQASELTATYFSELFSAWSASFEVFGAALRESLANWRDIDLPDIDTLNALVLEEGIPLAWVPNSDTLTLLLEAPDARARRQIIGRRWRGITNDCEEALAHLTSRAGLERATFIRAVIAAHRDGHHAAAQALATNIVDTVVNDLPQHFPRHKNKRPDLADRPVLEALVLGAVWSAYGSYHRGMDPVPQTFRRHATAHGVSARQYSRVNATFAVMCATSVAIYIEEFGPS